MKKYTQRQKVTGLNFLIHPFYSSAVVKGINEDKCLD